MKLNLTWDLFIIVFVTLIIAYSYIIGSNKTLKIMLGSYIAILISDGIGNLLVKFSLDISETFGLNELTGNNTEIIIIKIVIFIFSIVALGTRGIFKTELPEGIFGFKKIIIILIFSFLSATQLIATILVFVSGGSFLSETGINMTNSNISNIYDNSYLAQLIVLNYNLIFVMPAVAFVTLSLIYGNEDDSELE